MFNRKEVLFIKEEYGEGRGTFTYPDGRKYVGDWKNGKFHGQGTYTFSNGRKYVGEYKDGKKNGQGTFTFPNGWKYVGEWKDGDINGFGILTIPNGKKGIGEFIENKPWNISEFDKNGNIKYKFVNGEKIKQKPL